MTKDELRMRLQGMLDAPSTQDKFSFSRVFMQELAEALTTRPASTAAQAADTFADIRDKRMSELDPEQLDRAAELWLRDNMGWEDRRLHPTFDSIFRVIDRLRAENAQYRVVASEANVTVPAQTPLPNDLPHWCIRHEAFDSIRVFGPRDTSVGGTVVTKNRGTLGERVLFDLCEALIGKRPTALFTAESGGSRGS